MEAASAGNVDIVNLLIEHRADVNAKSAAGKSCHKTLFAIHK